MYSATALPRSFRKMNGGIIKPKLEKNLRSLTPISENRISFSTAKKNSPRFNEASARIENRRRHGINAAKRLMDSGAEPSFGYKLKVSIFIITHFHTSVRIP